MKTETYNTKKGQALAEVLIALGIGVILIGAATITVIVALRANMENRVHQMAASLGEELMDNVRTVSGADWHNIYGLLKGEANRYHTFVSGTQLIVASGAETVVLQGLNFTRYFFVENVRRDGAGNVATIGENDPSTQKITIKISFVREADTAEVSFENYISRWKNIISEQQSWERGPIGEVVREYTFSFATTTGIDYTSLPGSIYLHGFTIYTTNIDSVRKYAWSDIAGWLDMRAADYEQGVVVSTNELSGFGHGPNYKLVSFNCRNRNECLVSNFRVLNTVNGILSGYAWSETCGWLSFNCSDMATHLGNPNFCATVSNYRVTIDSMGIFRGYAWSENCGWIVFNCANLAADLGNPNFCANVSNFYVKTEWTSM